MSAGRLIQLLRTDVAAQPLRSTLELGTVLSIDPIIVTLDLEQGLELSYADSTLIVNDELLLGPGDRVVLSQLINPHQYVVLCRIGGASRDQVDIGDRSKTLSIARLGDTVAVSLSTGLGTITGASTKVKVE